MKEPAAILRKNREKSIRQRHPWIFSGAVQSLPDFENGSLLAVRSAQGEHLGYAYFNRNCSIIGRMVSFDETPPEKAIEKSLERAIGLRGRFFGKEVTACRLVNGEGDDLPGLVVDRYADILVVQVTTLGMEKLKPFILELLIKKIAPRSIYEKSALPSRREEGLPDREGFLYGESLEQVEIAENGLRFIVDIARSQKTGFFLDQREMRTLVRSLSSGRRILDCFAYTGGFSVNALAGGAERVDAVDSSEQAASLAQKNIVLNGLAHDAFRFFTADVFQFLRERSLDYDFVILDPPAFAKKKGDVISACRGYKDINRLAFQKMPGSGLVLTFSCSFFVDEALFQKVIFEAALEAGRRVRILQRHRMAPDHPVSIYHPESHYLKGFLLYID
jgi:23S rRNA (cytosine1962-C5)-methyltransferase